MKGFEGWWIVFTLGGAAAQTVRNVMQRGLTERVGTIGATHVRFLFGLPFGLAFLAGVHALAGLDGVRPNAQFLGLALAGALAQIAGTALMLVAMRERSFLVTTAYLKTEPAQLALFALVFLGEQLGAVATAAVMIATAGVMLMSMPGKGETGATLRPALVGIAAGAMFALSAVGFRGAVVALGDVAPFFVRAPFAVATTLLIQSVLLTAWLLMRDRRALAEIFAAWRPSLVAGLAGAAASEFWFLAFSLQSAATVRTVGLIEVLFALLVSRRLAQRMRPRELLGIALMVVGLIALVNA